MWTSRTMPKPTRKERIEQAAAQILAAMVGPTEVGEMTFDEDVQAHVEKAVVYATALVDAVDKLEEE